jgi:hypothetical protein
LDLPVVLVGVDEAFRQAAGPRLQETLKGNAKGPPTIRLFEVYEPKA